MIDGLGLRHFKGREFTPYWTSVRGGVVNSIPPENLWPNIVPTLFVLDEIRERLGSPISIHSSYRSERYNRAVGGEPNSFHQRFMALDWSAGSGTPAEWGKLARSLRGKLTIKIPGRSAPYLFEGGVGTYPTFVHIDCRPKAGDHYATW